MPKKIDKDDNRRSKMPLKGKQSGRSPKDKLTEGTQANE
jgi:hypothetical protein